MRKPSFSKRLMGQVVKVTQAVEHEAPSELFILIKQTNTTSTGYRAYDTPTDIIIELRGFAKLNTFQKSQKKWIELTPPTNPSYKLFFGNPSLTWTEHSNHNNQQLLAMHI